TGHFHASCYATKGIRKCLNPIFESAGLIEIHHESRCDLIIMVALMENRQWLGQCPSSSPHSMQHQITSLDSTELVCPPPQEKRGDPSSRRRYSTLLELLGDR